MTKDKRTIEVETVSESCQPRYRQRKKMVLVRKPDELSLSVLPVLRKHRRPQPAVHLAQART